MSYTPINWQTGDTITAEKLNKMDNGWGVESTQLFSETVTVEWNSEYNYGEALLAYIGVINSPTLIIIYDNTQYVCSAVDADGGNSYGAQWNEGTGYDFSTYPFNLYCTQDSESYLTTQTNGSHSITVMSSDIECSPNFASAVSAVAPKEMLRLIPRTTTWQEVRDAIDSGKPVYCIAAGAVEWLSWAGTNSHGDYVVCGLYYNGDSSSIATASHSAVGPDGVLN